MIQPGSHLWTGFFLYHEVLRGHTVQLEYAANYLYMTNYIDTHSTL